MFSDNDSDFDEEIFCEDMEIDHDDKTKEQLAELGKQAEERVTLAEKRFQDNPYDAEAIYTMYVSYNHGLGGLLEDKNKANTLLRKAAALGHQDACGICERIDMELKLRQEREAQDIVHKEEAKCVFNNKVGLEKAIEAEIIPCLVSIKTSQGYGTGFFQYSNWLVSNVHVLQNKDILERTTLRDFQQNKFKLATEQSFLRPKDRRDVLDIAIINIKFRLGENKKCLSTMFTDDKAHNSFLYFYIYFDQVTQKYEIKYLTLSSDMGSLPLCFKPEDNIDPQRGCSGAPVIEARVICGHKHRWQFRTIGAIYARRADHPQTQGSIKLACAIPVSYDFKQILEIIRPQDLAIRFKKMAEACDLIFQDQERQKKKEELFAKYELYTKKVEKLLTDYSDGKTLAGSISSNEEDELLVRPLEEVIAKQQRHKKEIFLKNLKEKGVSTEPFTPKFKKDHVYSGRMSKKDESDQIANTRNFDGIPGSKCSSMITITTEQGQKELEEVFKSLTIDALTSDEEEKYQIRKGIFFKTKETYPIITTEIDEHVSKRVVGSKWRRQESYINLAHKIINGELKIHHPKFV